MVKSNDVFFRKTSILTYLTYKTNYMN